MSIEQGKSLILQSPNHPNAVKLPPPFRVSPFIRFCRWGALGLGIVYGMARFSYLNRKHKKIREREHEQEVVSEYQNYRQREIKNKENVLALLKEAKIEVDDNIKKSFNLQDFD